jgi:hypothetical protein
MSEKLIYWLLALAVVDAIIPLPITGAIALYALIRKPRWFRTLCTEVTAETTPPSAP